MRCIHKNPHFLWETLSLPSSDIALYVAQAQIGHHNPVYNSDRESPLFLPFKTLLNQIRASTLLVQPFVLNRKFGAIPTQAKRKRPTEFYCD